MATVVLSNHKFPEDGQVSIPLPIPPEEYDHYMEQLDELCIGHATWRDCMVDSITYKKGAVWINKTQYFGNVPAEAWNAYIGGYQPAQKWLKDRKGRTLSFDDILHYHHIIYALSETQRLMAELG